MAIRFNPDGSITVGIIKEEPLPEVVAEVPFEEVKAEAAPKKKATKAKASKRTKTTKTTKKKAE